MQSETKPITQQQVREQEARAAAFWLEKLDESPILFWALSILVFAVILFFGMQSPLWGQGTEVKLRLTAYLVFLTLGCMSLYTIVREQQESRSKTFLVIWVSTLVHVGLVVFIHSHNIYQRVEVYEATLAPYILAPLLVTLLLGARMGAFTTVAVSTIGAFFVTPTATQQAGYLVTSMVTGMATVLFAQRVRRRSQILRTGVITGLIVLLVVPMVGGFKGEPNWQDFLIQFTISFGVSTLIAILVSGVLPVIEGLFRITTPISWLELADMNHPLLKQMQLLAPGTFHHSLMVSQLAEAAAEAVGANARYCRVAAYYHDIGKLKYPQYFIENLGDGEKSPHEGLTPSMSARIVINHVADGIALAEEYKLNKKIMDVIAQHHGNSLAYYFYREAMDEKERMEALVASGKAHVDDVPVVNESNFRYKGLSPQNREISIVSLADIVESATRSLRNPSYTGLKEMVDKVIKARVVDGHLDDSHLTFGDLKMIRNVFIETLKSMNHGRIAYPAEKAVHPLVEGSESTYGDVAPPHPAEEVVPEKETEERAEERAEEKKSTHSVPPGTENLKTERGLRLKVPSPMPITVEKRP